MMGLTPRMRECMDFIRAEMKENGRAPTLTELARGLGLSRNKARVHYLITSLVERGYVRRTRYFGTDLTRNRGIELVDTEHQHGPNCSCAACPARRFQYQQFIQALQCGPEMPTATRFDGIAPLSLVDRLEWTLPRTVTRTEAHAKNLRFPVLT